MSKINVTIVDDHPMVLTGLETLLKPYKNIKVTALYTRAQELMEGLVSQLPDVLLLDLLLPDRSGKDLVPELLRLYPSMVSGMMRKGCKGYLLKGAWPDALVEAIETVSRGEEYIEPALKEQLLQHVTRFKHQQNQDNDLLPELSQREKEILKLIAEENTTKEISEKLFISYRTAESHRYNLIQKLDVKNTAGLVKIAIQMGLVE
jgi:DNA-binding NarL/FixJ family response regulator